LPAKVDFVFFDAGGGHRAAATALESVFERQNRPWQPNLVNLQELLDSMDPFRKLTGLRMQDGYNLVLKKGWTLGSSQMLRLLQTAIRFYKPKQTRMLVDFWSGNPPDMVVSLVPNFNRALYEGFTTVKPGAPYVNILTDLADYPPHFWIEKQDQWVICGSDRAVEQAHEIGIPAEKIRQVSGMILRPNFYDPIETDRRVERLRLGLDADLPTGLVLFGGQGAGVMKDIARRLQGLEGKLQLIFLCGRNARLAGQVRSLDSRIPIHVEEFTTEVPYFMSLSDFLIGKPGPGSISEAIAMNIPVVVQRSAWTLPQERFNCDWVLEDRLGLVVSSFGEIAPAVERLLAPGQLGAYRSAAASIENRAVFEIPDILEEILETAT
jgi:hypothetical protein